MERFLKIAIVFGMPEILVIYSILIFQQTLPLSLAILGLGIMSRLFCFAQQREDRKAYQNMTYMETISERDIN